MQKKFKQLALLLVVFFLSISLLVLILTIWDILNSQTAKEVITKLGYTTGLIFALSSIIILLTQKKIKK